MRPIPWTLTLLLAVSLAACEKDVPAKVETPRPVRTVVAQPVAQEIALTLPAEIRPRIETRYGFRIGGKIAQRFVSVGDRVAPGALLARLDPRDIAPAIAAQSAQVEAARTDLTLARAELGRVRELHARNYLSAAQLDRQQAATDSAAARLDAAQAQLDAARNNERFQELRADAAGVVTAIEAEAGQVVAAGQPVIRVAGTADKEALVNLPEAQVEIARQVERWEVVVPALGDRRLQASLRELSPLSDPASRTYPMRLALNGDAQGVQLGMTAVVHAVRKSEPGFVLPITVLWSRDGRPHVWRVDEGTATVQPVPVRTDGFLDDAVRITAGLNAGDRIVTAGANLLAPGQKVRVLEASR